MAPIRNRNDSQGARSRGRDQQVAAELECQRREGGVVGAVEALAALVGGQGRVARGGELERRASVEPPVLGQVRGAQLLLTLAGRRAQDRLHARRGVARDVVVAHEVGGKEGEVFLQSQGRTSPDFEVMSFKNLAQFAVAGFDGLACIVELEPAG